MRFCPGPFWASEVCHQTMAMSGSTQNLVAASAGSGSSRTRVLLKDIALPLASGTQLGWLRIYIYIYTYIHTCTRAADNIACNTLIPSGLPKSDSHTPVLVSAAHRGLANLWFILEDMRGALPFPAKSKETTHDFSMTSRVTAALPVRGGVAQEASGRHGDVLGLPGDVFRTPKGRNFEHRCLTWGLVKKMSAICFPKMFYSEKPVPTIIDGFPIGHLGLEGFSKLIGKRKAASV